MQPDLLFYVEAEIPCIITFMYHIPWGHLHQNDTDDIPYYSLAKAQ